MRVKIQNNINMNAKNILVMISGAICLFLLSGPVMADTVTQPGQITFQGATTLSVALEGGTYSTFGAGTISWSNAVGSSNLIYATGHSSSKSDIIVICQYNGTGTGWALKMNFTSSDALAGKMKFYMGQPTYNSVSTNGTLGFPTPGGGQDWPFIPGSAATIYTSGSNDKINTTNGTWCGISFAITPVGLAAGVQYSGVITYTIVELP